MKNRAESEGSDCSDDDGAYIVTSECRIASRAPPTPPLQVCNIHASRRRANAPIWSECRPGTSAITARKPLQLCLQATTILPRVTMARTETKPQATTRMPEGMRGKLRVTTMNLMSSIHGLPIVRNGDGKQVCRSLRCRPAADCVPAAEFAITPELLAIEGDVGVERRKLHWRVREARREQRASRQSSKEAPSERKTQAMESGKRDNTVPDVVGWQSQRDDPDSAAEGSSQIRKKRRHSSNAGSSTVTASRRREEDTSSGERQCQVAV